MAVRRMGLIVGVLVLLAAGCSNGTTSSQPPDSAPEVADTQPAGDSELESAPVELPPAGSDEGSSDAAGAPPAPPAADGEPDEEVVDLRLAEGARADQGLVEPQPPAPEPEPEVAPLHPAERGALRNFRGYEFPLAPAAPAGPLKESAVVDLETIWAGLAGEIDVAAIAGLGQSGDARLAWILSDLLRFFYLGEVHEAAVAAFEALTGVSLAEDPVSARSPWQSVTDHLIAWDLPAFDDYAGYKRRLFTLVEPGWQPFFEDPEATIDWRLLSWGGVRIDDRPLGDSNPCPRGCIPALDDPPVTDTSGGSWYPDDAIVFALNIGGETRAYPRNIMEVHEMVNDTLGDRRIGFTYCTLCGSAQAYFTDDVPEGTETPVLRTSGLLSRSNKVMYDLITKSVFDAFTGEALSGPLRQRGVVLHQATVVTTTWGEWKAAHPETTIVASDGGIGRSYPLNPLGSRDAGGPIFPIGDVDERLGVHDQVFGVVLGDGTPVAFPVEAAAEALKEGALVELAGVSLSLDGGGLRASDAEGEEIEGHQAFWFAWSQFMPQTLLWQP